MQLIKCYLKQRSIRDYCLFVLGINTGLRVQDLLHLHVRDIADNDGNILLSMKQPCEGLPVYLNSELRHVLESFIKNNNLSIDDYLFQSRKTNEPISRQQAYRIINEAATSAGISAPIGTHTLRKTFGYHAYRKGIAISLIQKRLQQSAPSETLYYLGIHTYDPSEILLDVNL
nr:tyrosine-type recombinase/integrase [Metabacillus lacus]